ncbi:MAG: threonylcarbamoyl-AMP synthase [Thermomicrobiales bacterium]|nr:threonylcarbamoyl-AMP synthase [Thermomicrobiales bacterium]
MEPSAPLAIIWTAEQLRDGGVVSFPTDTVYGLAGSLAHPAALDRIFAIKGRLDDKPLPVLLASAVYLRDVANNVAEPLRLLAERFWPGPLTVVVPARAGLPAEVLGRGERGEATVGVRVPDHFLAIDLIERAGGAVAATSANRSGEPPACTAAEVAATLGGEVDILLDGGRAPVGRPSTVIAPAGDEIRILREGAIDRATLEAAWREIVAETRS